MSLCEKGLKGRVSSRHIKLIKPMELVIAVFWFYCLYVHLQSLGKKKKEKAPLLLATSPGKPKSNNPTIYQT